MGNRHLPLLAIFLMVQLLVAGEWAGIRDGVIHLRASGPTRVTVSWRGVWAADGHDESLYLQGQDGRLLRRLTIPSASVDGRVVLELPVQADYRLSIPGYSFRAYTVSTPKGCDLLFEPALHHPCIQTTNAVEWYFRIDRPGTFILHAKDHRGGHAVHVTAPDGVEQVLSLHPVETIPYSQHDSLIVKNAIPGNWKVSLDGSSKIAIWLTGCAPFFAAAGDPLWLPRVDTGTAAITVTNEISGITPRLATLLPERELPAFAYDTLKKLGVTAATYYLQRSRHGDLLAPHFSNWHTAYRNHLKIGPSHGILQSVPRMGGGIDTVDHPLMRVLAKWNQSDTFYTALYDEPNTQFSGPADFMPVIASGVATAKSNPLLALPESAGFINGPMTADASKRRGSDWARILLAKYGGAVGALTWHEWNIRDLPATEYYHRTIDSAWALSHKYPGGSTRKLMITQTNISSGGDFAPAQQEGFYAALWYASVIAQSASTGKLSMLGWFPAVDDTHHVKGLMHWDGIRLRVRPVGRAAAMISPLLFPHAVMGASSSFEVDMATSQSINRDTIGLLLVNKAARVQRVSAVVSLPPPLINASIQTRISHLEESGLSSPSYPILAPAQNQVIKLQLPPSSITGILLFNRRNMNQDKPIPAHKAILECF